MYIIHVSMYIVWGYINCNEFAVYECVANRAVSILGRLDCYMFNDIFGV